MRKSPNKDLFKISHVFLLVWWLKLKNIFYNSGSESISSSATSAPGLRSAQPAGQPKSLQLQKRQSILCGQQIDSAAVVCKFTSSFLLPKIYTMCIGLTQLYLYNYREDNPFFADSSWIPRQLSASLPLLSSFPRYTLCV